MSQTSPPGFERCPACGEFNGTTKARHLNWAPEPPEYYGDVYLPAEARAKVLELKQELAALRDPEEDITVRCLCQGTLCQKCGRNRVHRSGSNSYDERTNSVEHWPWFAGMLPCVECRDREAG
jgi:hypothetical protein